MNHSSLLDVDYEEPFFNHQELKFSLDPTNLTDRLCRKEIIVQDKSKVFSDTDPIPTAIVLKSGMFD